MEDRPKFMEFLCLACGTQGMRLVEGDAERELTDEPGPQPGFKCPRCGEPIRHSHPRPLVPSSC